MAARILQREVELSIRTRDYVPIRLRSRKAPFDDRAWLYEIKHDGFRGLAVIEEGRCQLFSRTHHRFQDFRSLEQAMGECVRTQSVVLDGEIVCFDAAGRADFAALFLRRSTPLFLAFDLLAINGQDWRAKRLLERKRRLRRLIGRATGPVRYVDHVIGRGIDFFQACCDYELEGMVAKRCSDPYDPIATRWYKIKVPPTQPSMRSDGDGLKRTSACSLHSRASNEPALFE